MIGMFMRELWLIVCYYQTSTYTSLHSHFCGNLRYFKGIERGYIKMNDLVLLRSEANFFQR